MDNDTSTPCLPGDILFYAQANGDIEDTAIATWTGSPFVHVAIAISAMQKIEAVNQGVLLDPITYPTIAAIWRGTSKEATALSDALSWLQKQVGQMYGYADLIDAVLWKVEHGVALDTMHFDCSALATEFLLKCGGIKEIASVTDPHVITPASLAALLGVAHAA